MKLNTKELYLDLTKGLDPTQNQKEGITYLISEYQNTLEENKDLWDLVYGLPDDWLEKYLIIDENDMINYINQTLHTNIKPVEDPKPYPIIWVNQIRDAVDTLNRFINKFHTQQKQI